MIKMTDIIHEMPKMKMGKQLLGELAILPEYDTSINKQDEVTRLMALNDIYKIYVPTYMSVEIYNKLYLALFRALQKKGSDLVTKQHMENYKAIKQSDYQSIIGGADSFTIIGTSGIGKSSAISRALDLITENKIITVDEPYTRIIPCLCVQCPFDSSIKGMLLEILRKVDEFLGSKYYKNAINTRASTDVLIGCVSQVALNHIGLLIVDEIQNVVNSKNGRILVGALTQLINNSGISIAMVGTPESCIFFEQAMQLARRSLGLQYGAMEYDTNFKKICEILFSYQYVKYDCEITEIIINWLYEHSGGNVSVIVSLVHDAQEIAILNGSEKLDLEALNQAYKKRLKMLHNYTRPEVKKSNYGINRKQTQMISTISNADIICDVTIVSLVESAKKVKEDIVSLLKGYITVEEVSV